MVFKNAISCHYVGWEKRSPPTEVFYANKFYLLSPVFSIASPATGLPTLPSRVEFFFVGGYIILAGFDENDCQPLISYILYAKACFRHGNDFTFSFTPYLKLNGFQNDQFQALHSPCITGPIVSKFFFVLYVFLPFANSQTVAVHRVVFFLAVTVFHCRREFFFAHGAAF